MASVLGWCCLAAMVGSAPAPRAESLPGELKGCVLWLRADAGAMADSNGRVTKWLDQSGQRHDVDKVSGNAPVLATGLNNKPVVRFDGQGSLEGSYDFRKSVSAHSLLLLSRWTDKNPACCQRVFFSPTWNWAFGYLDGGDDQGWLANRWIFWKADKWDPEKLIRLYKRAGARYFVAMANHHDNFDNWNSKYQPWNSVNIGPKKDIVGTWAKLARENGLRFGVTVHAARAWSFYEPAHGSDKTGPLAGVPYDGALTKADGKGLWWEGYDPGYPIRTPGRCSVRDPDGLARPAGRRQVARQVHAGCQGDRGQAARA